MLISLSNLNRVKAHAKAAYPEECCGLLIGCYEEERGIRRNIVRYVAPCANRWFGDRTQGFEIPAYQRYDIEMTAKELGLSVVGAYHSHTLHGAFPSADDCDSMAIYQTMLIVAVKMGVVQEARAYCKDVNREIFEERIEFCF
ncbi:MAG: M67 family metallopeptidase [Chloroherpetonaceae bacterium]|nr:M67 family metallopeptidase [Chloroherpetonaceae bacterium]MDW8437526.1 M67 family metallopeptidase [Chloroherpetonaceae bacterium]